MIPISSLSGVSPQKLLPRVDIRKERYKRARVAPTEKEWKERYVKSATTTEWTKINQRQLTLVVKNKERKTVFSVARV